MSSKNRKGAASKDGSPRPKAASPTTGKGKPAKVEASGQVDKPPTEPLSSPGQESGEQVMMVPICRTLSQDLNEECWDTMMLSKATASLQFTCEQSVGAENKQNEEKKEVEEGEEEEHVTEEVQVG